MIVPLDHTICDVAVVRRNLCVELADGRQVCAPIEWFPLLHAAQPALNDEFKIADDGLSVSWPRLGETVTVEFLLASRQSVARPVA